MIFASMETGLLCIMLFIFKDSILGFVSGVQLSQNNMIQLGDWIQMPDGSANGTVEEITLNTVKVRNWDNTLSMIPPYTLVSAPFKNWRGMQESGGRRADKCIYIDVNSLEICSEDMISDILKVYPILYDYMKAAGTTGQPSSRETVPQMTRVYGGIIDRVLSQLRTLTVFKVISSTVPFRFSAKQKQPQLSAMSTRLTPVLRWKQLQNL